MTTFPQRINHEVLHCQSDLIWGGDHDFEEDPDGEYDILTNLSCSTCNTYVEVYHKFGEIDRRKKEEQPSTEKLYQMTLNYSTIVSHYHVSIL